MGILQGMEEVRGEEEERMAFNVNSAVKTLKAFKYGSKNHMKASKGWTEEETTVK